MNCWILETFKVDLDETYEVQETIFHWQEKGEKTFSFLVINSAILSGFSV